jgi:inner membrane protein
MAVDPLTHLTTGLICSQLLPAPSRWWAAAAGAIFAVLPDADYLCIFWDRLAFIRYHRGFTHSLVAVPLFALAGALLGRALGGPRWLKPLFLIGIAVLLSHLLLDLATSYGTQILSPFSRRRFSLDWIFIIDPYFTTLLLAGAIAALAWPRWGPRAGAGLLAAAAVYLLVCASYHHQALDLARRVFPGGAPREQTVAALPQPFSCRRWQLITASPANIQQAFVQLPWAAALGQKAEGGPAPRAPVNRSQDSLAPAIRYPAPDHLTIQTWNPAKATASISSPEAESILGTFLEFARFPLLWQVQSQGGEQILEWRDLRFSIPGRAFPFVLQLRLDANGKLQHWLIGRRG